VAISEAQREAARRNGAKGRGPKTEAGKRASARNATKHGLSGSGLFLPEGMEAEVVAEYEIYSREFRPVEYYETRLVEQAALAQVRKNRLFRAELLWTADRARMAVERHDEQRAAEVRELVGLLAEEPAAALEGLRRSTEGCDWLADTWDDLGAELERARFWDEERARLALNLMGHRRPPDATRDPEAARVWRLLYALRVHADPRSLAKELGRTPEELLAGLPPRAEALAELRSHVAETIRALEARAAELWERRDRPRREAASDLALFDPGPEFARLMRYLSDAERLQRRALAELERRRRQAESRRDPLDEPPRSAPAPAPAPAAIPPAPAPTPGAAASPRPAADPAPTPEGETLRGPIPPASADIPEQPERTDLARPSRNEPGAPAPHPRL
jgi:hypothetical protein